MTSLEIEEVAAGVRCCFLLAADAGRVHAGSQAAACRVEVSVVVPQFSRRGRRRACASRAWSPADELQGDEGIDTDSTQDVRRRLRNGCRPFPID